MTSTETRVGFTASADGSHARCLGTNHKDTARLGICDGCAYPVAKTDTGRILNISYNHSTGARRIACWSAEHVCDPTNAAAYAAARAESIAAGTLVKGATVTVVKGRKVALGTTGVVCWIGQDSYGTDRVGIRVDGQTVFTATSNVEVTR